MTRSLLALAILGLSTGSALAAPGDPRVVEGTLEWPATVSNEPFIVVRGTDGRSYYADIASAQRRTTDTMTSGSRVAVLGVEGGRPYELTGIAIGAGDASSLGLTTSSVSSPSASIPGTAIAPGPPPEPMWRLDGTVQSVAGTTVTLRTTDGRTHAVDVSPLSDKTLRALRRGERVSLFGVPRKDRRLVANGYIQSEQAAAPAASPRSTR